MKINDVNLGGGLFRLDVTPTFYGEDTSLIPQREMDNIMKDVVRRIKNGEKPSNTPIPTPCSAPQRQRDAYGRFVCTTAPQREPDGIDAHIDRPQRQTYGYGWGSENAYQRDLKKYRTAETAIKACDWPCREPMQTTAPVFFTTAPSVAVAPKKAVKKTATPKKAVKKSATQKEINAVAQTIAEILIAALG